MAVFVVFMAVFVVSVVFAAQPIRSLVSKMGAVVPANHTAAEDGVVLHVRVSDHNTTPHDGVQADDGYGVEFSLKDHVALIVTGHAAQNALNRVVFGMITTASTGTSSSAGTTAAATTTSTAAATTSAAAAATSAGTTTSTRTSQPTGAAPALCGEAVLSALKNIAVRGSEHVTYVRALVGGVAVAVDGEPVLVRMTGREA